jgi:anti-sigma-K factor RskA
MTRDEEHLSSGAYALNALSPDEARAFEQASAASPELADETAEFSATATLLGLATAPVSPPDSLKASLMAKLAETAQDAPAPARASAPLDAPEFTPAPQQSPAQPALLPAAAAAQSRWFTRPMTILVAAAAAVALFVGGGVVGNSLTSNTPSTSEDASASSLAQIFSAADVQSAHSTIAGGGQATVIWSGKNGGAAIVAQGIPSLPSNKTYEAWFIDSDTGVATPAGTFVPGGDATTWHVLSGNMSAGDIIGLTVEPAGGSQAPTTTPILAVPSA